MLTLSQQLWLEKLLFKSFCKMGQIDIDQSLMYQASRIGLTAVQLLPLVKHGVRKLRGKRACLNLANFVLAYNIIQINGKGGARP